MKNSLVVQLWMFAITFEYWMHLLLLSFICCLCVLCVRIIDAYMVGDNINKHKSVHSKCISKLIEQSKSIIFNLERCAVCMQNEKKKLLHYIANIATCTCTIYSQKMRSECMLWLVKRKYGNPFHVPFQIIPSNIGLNVCMKCVLVFSWQLSKSWCQ